MLTITALSGEVRLYDIDERMYAFGQDYGSLPDEVLERWAAAQGNRYAGAAAITALSPAFRSMQVVQEPPRTRVISLD
jgi:hypothetical protein